MSTKKSSWKDSIQTFGRSLLLPIALLAPIGMVASRQKKYKLLLRLVAPISIR